MNEAAHLADKRSVKVSDLELFICDLMQAAGMNEVNALEFSDIIMRGTLRGIGHHDVSWLYKRLEDISSGKLNANPNISLIEKYAALELYDGDNGPGELCTSFIVKKACELADSFGIGLSTVRNSNHFMAAAPYLDRAAEDGYLVVLFSRARPRMGMAGGKSPVIGNSPMGFASPTDRDFRIVMDACMAYASIGSLQELSAKGQSVPAHWGSDSLGNPTSDPGAILNGGIQYPIGGHKGFSIALLCEIITGVLSGGPILNEPNSTFDGNGAVHSQTAIVIKTDKLASSTVFKERVSLLVDKIKEAEDEMRMPGERSWRSTHDALESGFIEVPTGTIDELNRRAAILHVPLLPYG